ncbi:MAG: hypothetical protein FXF49_03935 [Flexistipes sinusarabici]|uniref:DUF4367 domain-containing protein n=1 Tax=Flexistipes sinusarabici TaxID=2352 RepID=A0A5D0MQG2_FLESI|nr:hypothetical protein [Flexistipes sinusarabici]TYB33900.1 MAG: hypothetical protein FXF49_03935 [Flexistipes sinusarabici]
MKTFKSIFIVFILSLVVTNTVWADKKNYPAKLGELKKIRMIEGEKAIQSVMKLHLGAKITLEDAIVAEYKGDNGKKAIIWASMSETSKTAENLIRRMNKKMPSSNMYRNFKSIKINGCKIYSVDGMGMKNYYFGKNKWNYWLAVNTANSRAVLNDFMGNLTGCKNSE